MACPGGRGDDVEAIHVARRRGRGSRAAARCVACPELAVEHLAACLAKPSSSLARQLGWAGRWAWWTATGKFFLLFLSVSFSNSFATLWDYLKYLGSSKIHQTFAGPCLEYF